MQKHKVIGYSIGAIGVVGLVGTALLFAHTLRQTDTPEPTALFDAQKAVRLDNRYPTGHIGMDDQFWSYEEVSTDTEYDDRQALLDSGAITLWPEFSGDHLMWFAGHYPGTMSYMGENLYIGATIEVTTPNEYDGRHQYDDPDVLMFEIVERVDTDIWAEETIATLGERATDLYNDGHDDSGIVIQHSGDTDDSVVLYYGTRLSDTTE